MGSCFLCQNQPSSFFADAASPTLSDSFEESLDNPWNRMPSLSLTPCSSDGESLCPRASSLPSWQETAPLFSMGVAHPGCWLDFPWP